MPEWSFLTNHARALVCIAHDPGVRLRDIATKLGITERSAYAIVTDLTAAGYVVKDKDTDGRRNRYQIQSHLPLPETLGRERTVGEVLDVLVDSTRRPGRRASRPTPQGRRSPHEPVPRNGRADSVTARQSPGQNRTMPTWEYLILELPGFEPATHAPGASAAVHALNAEGEQGWEAVGVLRLGRGEDRRAPQEAARVRREGGGVRNLSLGAPVTSSLRSTARWHHFVQAR